MRARDHGFQAELVRDLAPEVGSVLCLPQELGRVLVNLLGNAFDAIRGLESGKVTISTLQDEEHVVIRVSDNGPGGAVPGPLGRHDEGQQGNRRDGPAAWHCPQNRSRFPIPPKRVLTTLL